MRMIKITEARRGGINQSTTMAIKDETEMDSVNLRRAIYLTLMSSGGFEEAGHKLLRLTNGEEEMEKEKEKEKEKEVCIMLVECCRQQEIYCPFYGLVAERLCTIKANTYQDRFDECFVHYYSMVHRMETNAIDNVAKLFAHLLAYDALPWRCLTHIRLTEKDTNSSSRIFIRFLFQELCLNLGIRLLIRRLTEDPAIFDASILPKDKPENTRFAINFFTAIGLGGISENLRIHLKNSAPTSSIQGGNKRRN